MLHIVSVMLFHKVEKIPKGKINFVFKSHPFIHQESFPDLVNEYDVLLVSLDKYIRIFFGTIWLSSTKNEQKWTYEHNLQPCICANICMDSKSLYTGLQVSLIKKKQ